MDELYLLLPALLGLKGNLQMTLASRFSTHSHLGHIQTTEDLLGLTCANLALNQCLSIVISLAASLLTVVIHALTSDEPFDDKRPLLITCTALLTSSVTSFLLDILMILVVQISTQLKINPDNVATPIAASLGDITALMLCSVLAKSFYQSAGTGQSFYWLASIIIFVYLFLVPIWTNITQENVHTLNIIVQPTHWYPLITAMIISSMSGIILKAAIAKSEDIALFQPVICGVGGNLVAVQASRIATLLHRNGQLGALPENEAVCMNPCHMFNSSTTGFTITRLLMSIVIPGQIIFYFLCIYLNSREISWPFLALYLLGSELQVVILLYLAYVLTFVLWKLNVDPDNCTIPYLTSISDVLGACIITLICLVAVPSTPKSVAGGTLIASL